MERSYLCELLGEVKVAVILLEEVSNKEQRKKKSTEEMVSGRKDNREEGRLTFIE